MLSDSLKSCTGTCGILFLGDNVYESGLALSDHPDRVRGEQILDAQLEVARLATGPAIFVPGNHDSGGRGVGGDLKRLEEMERYVESKLGDGSFLPRDGLPGPAVVHPHPAIALIVINSQWWFEGDHRGESVGRTTDFTRQDIIHRIEQVLKENADRHVILATHHPVRSAGDHALYWQSRVTVMGLLNQVVGRPQDYSERAYQRYRNDILSLTRRHPDLILVSGHEHNLTYFDSPGHHVVSGSLSRPEWVSHRNDPTFASDAAGFGALRVSADGALSLSFSGINDDDTRERLFVREISRLSEIATSSGTDAIPERTYFATPPPSLEAHLSPDYSEWRGAGAFAQVRYTIPDTRIRPRIVVDVRARYHHRIRGSSLQSRFHIEHTASATGIHIGVQHAEELDHLTGTDHITPIRHVLIEIEPYKSRYAYDRLMHLTIGVAGRYHHTKTESWIDLPVQVSTEAHASMMLRLGTGINTLDSDVVPEGGVDAGVEVRAMVYDDHPARLGVEGGIRYFRSIGFARPLTLALNARGRMVSATAPLVDTPTMAAVRGYPELAHVGQATLTSTAEVRRTFFHLDRRRNRSVGLLAFVDVGVLFPYRERDPEIFRPDPEDLTRVENEDPVLLSSSGAGVWANVSRRVVMTASVVSSDGSVAFTLGPSFHF